MDMNVYEIWVARLDEWPALHIYVISSDVIINGNKALIRLSLLIDWSTVKILKFRTPEKFAVIIQKFEQDGLIIE